MINAHFQAYMKPTSNEAPANRKIIGYTRVSSKQQADNYSIAEQENEIRAYAKKNNYILTEIIGGTYESASGDLTRKEFKKLYDTIKKSKKRPFAIAIKFINRFSRTGASAISIVSELVDKMGVHLIETSTGLCTVNVKDKMLIFHKLLEAQQENQERLERTMPGLKAFLKQGNKLGTVPFGYIQFGKRVKDFERMSRTQMIKITEQGEILKSAWQWKLQGERDTVIIYKLEKLGVKLNLKQIGKIFRNPFYCGVSINKMLDTPVKGNWEPMISQTNFLKIQGIIKPSKVGTYQVSSTDENRPLARFLVCANCESYLTGYEVKNKKIHYYKCPKCNGVNMNVSSTKQSRNKGLNDHFIEMLRTITLKPEAKEPFNELMKRLFKDLNGDTINEIHEQNNSIQDLKNKLMNLEEKYLYDNAIDKDVYLKHRANLEAKIWEAEQNVAESASLSSNFDEYLLKATEVCENLSKYWVLGDHDNKQRIQKMLFPEGLVVVPVSRVLLTDNLNQIFKLIPCLESVSEVDKKEKASKIADLSLSVARRRFELPTSGL